MKWLCSLTACFLSPALFASAIEIGASVQKTGPLANTGRYYADAYQFAVDRINEKGGVTIGDKKEKLNLTILDNQSDVNLSVRQYVDLVSQNKVNFLLGPFASNFALADSSISEKYKIPMIQGGGASDEIFTRGYKYVFGTLAPATAYFQSTIDFMQQVENPPKTIALLYADDSFDVSVADGARKALGKTPLKVVIDEKYSSNASDFSSLFARIREQNVDAILVAGHETEILNFIRQAKALNINPKMYSFTVGVPSADFRKALGKDADYAFGMTAWLPSESLKDDYFGDAMQFAEEYKKRFGYEPDYHAASAIADVEALVKAIEIAKSIDPKLVRDAIAGLDFKSLYGPIHFQANGQINLPQIVIQVQNGKLVPIFGQKGKLEKPLYPMPGWDVR